MSDIFISYSRSDVKCARFLKDILEAEGWSVWFDRRRLEARGTLRQEIREALEEATCVITLWSENSVQSKWVKFEAGKAHELRKVISVTIDGVPPPERFRRAFYIDFTAWKDIVDIDTENESDEDLEAIIRAVCSRLGEKSLKERLYWYLRFHEGWWCWPGRIKEDAACYMRFESISTERLSKIREALDSLYKGGWIDHDSGTYCHY